MRPWEKLDLRTKSTLLISILFLAILWFGSIIILEKWELSRKMATYEEMVQLAVRVGALVHDFQKERGMSSGFIGSQGKKFAAELPEQRKNSDRSLLEWQNHLKAFDLNRVNLEFTPLLTEARQQLEQLAATRGQVDQRTITAPNAITYYTRTIGRLLELVGQLEQSASDPEMVAHSIAYYNFLQGKERTGIERAILTGTFAQKGFAPGMFLKLASVVSEQETYFANFLREGKASDVALYRQKMADPAVQEVQTMRTLAFEGGTASPLYVLLGRLYQNMALRGAYHSIKNLLIRGSYYDYQNFEPRPDMQDKYRKQFKNNLQAIQGVVAEIRALPPGSLSPEQRQDVETVLANVEAYDKSIEPIIAQQSSGRHLYEIDNDQAAGAKIDDNPADAAIRRLVKSTAVGEFGVDPNHWFKTITHKIDLLKEVEEHLAQELINDSQIAQKRATTTLWSFALTIIVGLTLVALLIVIGIRATNRRLSLVMVELRAMAAGNFTNRLPIKAGHHDEIDEIAERVNFMADALSKNVKTVILQSETIMALVHEQLQVNEFLKRDADGNSTLAQQVVEENNIIDGQTQGLHREIRMANDNIISLAGAATYLSENVTAIAAASEQASQNVTTMAAAAEEMTGNISSVNNSLELVNRSVNTVSGAVTALTHSMNDVTQRCQAADSKAREGGKLSRTAIATIDELRRSAQEIGKVVGMIRSIAGQTNLLALNAAIEASGAGQAGVGFAVVANEVKDLAKQTADATRLIEDKIDEIRTKAHQATKDTHGIGRVIAEISDATNEITTSIAHQNEAVQSIHRSMGEVTAAGNEVAGHAEELRHASHEVARAAEEAALGTAEIARSATSVANNAEQVAEHSGHARQRVESVKTSSQEIFAASAKVQKMMLQSMTLSNDLNGSIKQADALNHITEEASQFLKQASSGFDLGKSCFDIRQIKQNHLQWIGLLEQVIRGRLQPDAPGLPNHQICDLKQWCEGSAHLEQNPLFHQLEQHHKDLHQTIATVLKLAEEDLDLAENAMEPFHLARRQMFDVLDQLFIEATVEG